MDKEYIQRLNDQIMFNVLAAEDAVSAKKMIDKEIILLNKNIKELETLDPYSKKGAFLSMDDKIADLESLGEFVSQKTLDEKNKLIEKRDYLKKKYDLNDLSQVTLVNILSEKELQLNINKNDNVEAKKTIEVTRKIVEENCSFLAEKNNELEKELNCCKIENEKLEKKVNDFETYIAEYEAQMNDSEIGINVSHEKYLEIENNKKRISELTTIIVEKEGYLKQIKDLIEIIIKKSNHNAIIIDKGILIEFDQDVAKKKKSKKDLTKAEVIDKEYHKLKTDEEKKAYLEKLLKVVKESKDSEVLDIQAKLMREYNATAPELIITSPKGEPQKQKSGDEALFYSDKEPITTETPKIPPIVVPLEEVNSSEFTKAEFVASDSKNIIGLVNPLQPNKTEPEKEETQELSVDDKEKLVPPISSTLFNNTKQKKCKEFSVKYFSTVSKKIRDDLIRKLTAGTLKISNYLNSVNAPSEEIEEEKRRGL